MASVTLGVFIIAWCLRYKTFFRVNTFAGGINELFCTVQFLIGGGGGEFLLTIWLCDCKNLF